VAQGFACGGACPGTAQRSTQLGQRVRQLKPHGGGFEDGDGLFEQLDPVFAGGE